MIIFGKVLTGQEKFLFPKNDHFQRVGNGLKQVFSRSGQDVRTTESAHASRVFEPGSRAENVPAIVPVAS
jgi:hypothetical protein